MGRPSRIVGLDVARAVAVLGMIVVNFRGKVHPEVATFTKLAWILDRMEGKWAAVFVVLAGLGIGLQARAAMTALARTRLRRSLLTRAVILLAIGVLHQHWWTWDIVAFYGVYIAASVIFLWAPTAVLWAGIAGLTLGSGWQWMTLTRPELDFWTVRGAIGKLFFWGNHPVLPWFALVLFGLWLSRQELRSSRTRTRLFVAGAIVLVLGEALNGRVRAGGPALADPPILDMLRNWPRPTRPGFVTTGVAFATMAITAAVEFTEGREHTGVVTTLQAGGQLALTLYIAHVPAILVPLAHGWAPDQLPHLVGYSIAFYTTGLAAALWWRRRFERGPLEGLLAAVTTPPSPPPGRTLAGRIGTA